MTTTKGNADALGKSLDGRDDRLRPTPGALVVDYGVNIAYLMRRPEVFITVDCRENFGDAKPWANMILAAPDLLTALRDLRAACEDAYKAGRIPAEPFVRAGNVIASAERGA